MKKLKASRVVIFMMMLVITLLVFDNLRMRYQQHEVNEHLKFRETADSVSLKVRYIAYACGDCFPDYFLVQEVLYSDSGDTLKYLYREIMADFQSKEDEERAFSSQGGDHTSLIFRGEMLENNYQMLKMQVLEVVEEK